MYLFEQISVYCTPRKCTECQKPASMWRFVTDIFHVTDKSSRQPVCTEHSEACQLSWLEHYFYKVGVTRSSRVRATKVYMTYIGKKKQKQFQLNRYHTRQSSYIVRSGGKCLKCDGTTMLEFLHKEREQKISHRIWSWSTEHLETELSKCDLLCKECHQKETNEQFGFKKYVHGTSLCYGATQCRCILCRKANAVERAEYRKRTGKRQQHACVAELGYAPDLDSGALTGLSVRLAPQAPNNPSFSIDNPKKI